MSFVLLGCGSEIVFPNEEPDLRLAPFLRCAPRRQIPATARRIPRARPGKKPARIAAPGNLEHVSEVAVVLSEEEVDVVEDAGDMVVEEVELGSFVGFASWFVSMEQIVLLQWKPKGQHLSPHVSIAFPSADVFKRFVGWRVAFWSWMSQEMPWIAAQFAPGGQQRRVVLPASSIHVDPEGQQKFEGSFVF